MWVSRGVSGKQAVSHVETRPSSLGVPQARGTVGNEGVVEDEEFSTPLTSPKPQVEAMVR